MSHSEKPSLLANKLSLLGAALQARGGAAALERILVEFYDAMSTDILIGFFFSGKDLSTIARRQSEFLARAFGLSASYNGKPPSEAHRALPPILSGHFDRRLVILKAVLERNGFTELEIETWLAFENAFRDAVVAADPRS